MKYESVLNQPGGMSCVDGETRIVGFRVKVSEILKTKESYHVIALDVLMEELAVTYLKNNGYEVKKKSTCEVEPYSKCTSCGEHLGEYEVYGEWDDYCKDCFYSDILDNDGDCYCGQ